MAITPTDVKAGFATDVPDDEIAAIIAILDEADTCLNANNVPAGTQDLLKTYAARHLLTMQAGAGRGTVRSESSPSGASRSYSGGPGGMGLNATRYGDLLKQLDRYGCVRGLIENTRKLAVFSAGPHRVRGGQEYYP